MTTLIEYSRLYGQPLKGALLEADDTIKQLTAERDRLRSELAKLREQKPDHWVANCDDPRNPYNIPLWKHPAPIPEGWQPIETAPKIGCHLAFDSRPHTHPYVIVWLDAEHPDADEAGWHEHWSFDPVEPTHWMPLPKPPMAAARSE